MQSAHIYEFTTKLQNLKLLCNYKTMGLLHPSKKIVSKEIICKYFDWNSFMAQSNKKHDNFSVTSNTKLLLQSDNRKAITD